MLRTVQLPCALPKAEADSLNLESGAIYSRTLIWHYRVYRRKGVWLSPSAQSRLEDTLGGATTLHAHSRDAAQQGFSQACQTAKAARLAGLPTHYPHKRKRYRTTTWKSTGISLQNGKLRLARARGITPILVGLPESLAHLPPTAFRQMELVWDCVGRRYHWHLTIEDGKQAAPSPGTGIGAIDLGEVHPVALTDGKESVVISLRELRSARQYMAKRLSKLQALQAKKHKGSKAWRRLQRRKSRFLAQQKRRTRDLEHKASRATVEWAVEHEMGTLVIGDVRDVADGKRLHRHQQQKIGLWSHGKQRQYIIYKAEAAGLTVAPLVDEAYSTQTCPSCGHRYKPRGRLYRCPACGLVRHRDCIGAANLLSRHLYGEVGKIVPPITTMYRHPFVKRGKRSRPDAADLACRQR
jgi:putative transposase